ncbi:hypothetical protein [Bacillus atrophaeus]|uniref:hypothetical protein n=1 Tax=Bacillus atrophaeus TaxID=1452 RepID=UPI002DB8C682|nr:hypothetical protein [Bacillus atrophaeus]MEC1900951.1 hypothetical protein [Bacillus atrophaeus]MEC2396116.1 hypothetical protein [Bacillus atrophaeus]MED4437288.1 hypothetical protein [Bacillus atrophaeus]MED4567032.1 hypothetical protein [Bacillus atrophaeus]MED4573354.1 hypothetical protein [Bacillus atrophaeus]
MFPKTFLGVNEEGFVIDVFYQNSEDQEPPVDYHEAPTERFYMNKWNFKNKCWIEGLTPEDVDRMNKDDGAEPPREAENEKTKEQVLDLQRVCNLLMNQ